MRHLTALWLLLWIGGAHAATGEEFATTMLAIPPLAWILALAAAVLGGVIRIISERNKSPPAIELSPGAIGGSMFWSIVAGAIGFLAALAIPALPPTAIPLMVFGCAVVGRPVVHWLTSFVSFVAGRIKREGGNVPPAP